MLFVSACGGVDSPPPAPGPPARVVSLAPSVTEIVYALGEGDRLVGVCGQCNYPEAVNRLPRVGGFLTPSVEAILAAHPDLVIAVPSPGNRDGVRAVEAAGVRVLVVHERSLADVWAAIGAISDALGVRPAGEALARVTQTALADVRARVAAAPRRRVLVVVGHRPLVAVGSDTLQDELVTLAGGINVGADAGAGWPQLSREHVLARRPEVVIDAAMGGGEGGGDLLADIPGARVVVLADDTLFRAGPRVALAAAAVARVLHPELMP